MTAMTTVLTQRSDAANVREWTSPGHTLAEQFVVRQKRTVASTASGRATDLITLIRGGVDVSGSPLQQPIMIRVEVTRQANSAPAAVAQALALAREVVASSNFDAVVSGQTYIQAG